MGRKDSTLNTCLRRDGSKLDGTFAMKGRPGPLSGSVEGNHVSFTVEGKKGTVSFQGTVDGNKMSGTQDKGVRGVPLDNRQRPTHEPMCEFMKDHSISAIL